MKTYQHHTIYDVWRKIQNLIGRWSGEVCCTRAQHWVRQKYYKINRALDQPLRLWRVCPRTSYCSNVRTVCSSMRPSQMCVHSNFFLFFLLWWKKWDEKINVFNLPDEELHEFSVSLTLFPFRWLTTKNDRVHKLKFFFFLSCLWPYSVSKNFRMLCGKIKKKKK